jgi:hypothetical protein
MISSVVTPDSALERTDRTKGSRGVVRPCKRFSASSHPMSAAAALPILNSAGRHPLDPLAASEIAQAFAVLTEECQVSDNHHFRVMALLKPDKGVLVWHETAESIDQKAHSLIIDRPPGRRFTRRPCRSQADRCFSGAKASLSVRRSGPARSTVSPLVRGANGGRRPDHVASPMPTISPRK